MAIKINGTTVIDDSRVGNLASLGTTGNITGNYFIGNGANLTGILFSSTSDATAANLTVDEFYLSASTALAVTNGESLNYLFDQYPGDNPTLYAVAGDTLAFRLALGGGHPITIQSAAVNYDTGLNHVTPAGTVSTGSAAQGKTTGTLYWKIPGNAAGTYTYQCSVHASMKGNIVVSSPTAGSFTSLSVTGNITGGNILTGGLVSATGNVTGGNLVTGGLVSATGNVSGGNLNVTGNIVDTGALTIITGSNGNITLAPNGSGVTIVNTDLRNGQANGVGNIGSSSGYFNTVFAKATSAQYADLAEKYVADAEYTPGTVVVFGGTKEVTVGTKDADSAVAGVISTNPSYIMNAGLESEFVAVVALTGRVPTCVTGEVKKGDLMVSTSNGHARAEADPKVGTVIGKALEDFAGDNGVIEVVIGRF